MDVRGETSFSEVLVAKFNRTHGAGGKFASSSSGAATISYPETREVQAYGSSFTGSIGTGKTKTETISWDSDNPVGAIASGKKLLMNGGNEKDINAAFAAGIKGGKAGKTSQGVVSVIDKKSAGWEAKPAKKITRAGHRQVAVEFEDGSKIASTDVSNITWKK